MICLDVSRLHQLAPGGKLFALWQTFWETRAQLRVTVKVLEEWAGNWPKVPKLLPLNSAYDIWLKASLGLHAYDE